MPFTYDLDVNTISTLIRPARSLADGPDRHASDVTTLSAGHYFCA